MAMPDNNAFWEPANYASPQFLLLGHEVNLIWDLQTSEINRIMTAKSGWQRPIKVSG
jgi:hypothetical protein